MREYSPFSITSITLGCCTIKDYESSLGSILKKGEAVSFALWHQVLTSIYLGQKLTTIYDSLGMKSINFLQNVTYFGQLVNISLLHSSICRTPIRLLRIFSMVHLSFTPIKKNKQPVATKLYCWASINTNWSLAYDQLMLKINKKVSAICQRPR